MKEVLQRIGLRYNDNLDLRRGFLIKFHKDTGDRGCLTLSLIREKVLVHQPRIQLVECVARSTMVIYLRGRTIVLVVVKVGTSFEIDLM